MLIQSGRYIGLECDVFFVRERTHIAIIMKHIPTVLKMMAMLMTIMLSVYMTNEDSIDDYDCADCVV